MAYSKESEKIQIRLIPDLWKILDTIAEQKGFSNSRRYINSEIKKIAKQYSSLQQCSGKKGKKAVLYQIPDEYAEVFKNVSCIVNAPVTTIIIMHLIPEILKHLAQNQPPADEPTA
jgi:hypothetical protein